MVCTTSAFLHALLWAVKQLPIFSKLFLYGPLWSIRGDPVPWSLVPVEFLLEVLGPDNSCWDSLDGEAIRFLTFNRLELKHTCCSACGYRVDFSILEQEEIDHFREENKEDIQLLETLLEELEEKRENDDLKTFLKSYWARRMKDVLREEGSMDCEKLREFGDW